MKLTLGFSTCPNDTFIFDAIIHNKVDTEELEFELLMADVEELNRNAFAGTIDITKLSYHAFAYVADKYKLLTSGSALGYKNGPLLITKQLFNPVLLSSKKIAIPGKYTTANLLLSALYPEVKDKSVYLFSDIEDAILRAEVDAGLIIHENRFTYEAKGLVKIVDLGEEWEKQTASPIPLGGIVVHRKHTDEIQQKINRVMRRSVEFALANPDSGKGFVKCYSQELDDEVIKLHINLYVNQFTVDLGETGKKAIRVLFEKAVKSGITGNIPEDIFVR
jgi:1,4-dihydroxy-6-naphthoate synthase